VEVNQRSGTKTIAEKNVGLLRDILESARDTGWLASAVVAGYSAAVARSVTRRKWKPDFTQARNALARLQAGQ
jgi:post-segregation antitoxin (ccd killing protein)